MTMISGGDEKVRNAFRGSLRDEPSQHDLSAVNATQELDASDILEVGDLASAIARAEEIIRLPQARDMFDVLGGGTGPATKRSNALAPATDDCIGPALPAPYGTPIPPPPSVAPPAPKVPTAPRAPVIMVPSEEDAYYHPGGNIRGFADVTLDGYRPEPTFQVKLRARRHSFGWVVGAILGPLALLGALSVFLRTTANATPEPPKPATITTQAAPPPPPVVTAAQPTVAPEAPPAVPMMDVKKLPTATPKTLRPVPVPRKH